VLQELLVNATVDEIPDVIGELEKWKVRFHQRLFENANENKKTKPEKEDDDVLTKEQAAAILNVAPTWFSGRKLPFKRRIGHRTVRYSKKGLLRWRDSMAIK
jgi:hypothetical protein